MSFYMTEEGRRELFERRDDLQRKIEAVRVSRSQTCRHATWSENGSIGDHAAHDNEEQILMRQLHDVEEHLRQRTVCPMPSNCTTVHINHVVDVRQVDNAGGKGRKLTYHIVGHGEGDPSATPQRLAYTAPVAKAILGLEVGDIGEVPGIKKSFEVCSISMPKHKPAEKSARPLLKLALRK